jgi:hypothetical protein
VGFEEGEFAADRVVGCCGNCSFSAQSDLEEREMGYKFHFPDLQVLCCL